MLKKTITYEDYDGHKRTEDFYFNLTKAELTEMYASEAGGFDKHLERIVSSQDMPNTMRMFKEILKRSYGEKSLDGRRFSKSEEIYKAFEESPAYDVIFMELFSDNESASAFIKGVLPKDLADEAASKMDEERKRLLPE